MIILLESAFSNHNETFSRFSSRLRDVSQISSRVSMDPMGSVTVNPQNSSNRYYLIEHIHIISVIMLYIYLHIYNLYAI